MAEADQKSSASQPQNAEYNITAQGSHNLAAGRDIIYHNSSQPKPVTSFRLIDKPVPHFTGREILIEQIHQLLTECATKTDYTERIVVLRGIGGMGKSETARKYVQMHINDPIIQNVAWIDSETKDSTEASFKNLASNLNLTIKPENKNTIQLAQGFYRHFSNHIKTGLIIFDNVEQLRDQNPYHGILDYLPTQLLDHVPLILIRSRINDWEIPLEGKYIIEISGLGEEAAVAYLYKNLKIQAESSVTQAFRRLANVIDGYPLGLTLAASTIKSYGSEEVISGVNYYMTRLDISKQDWIQDKLSAGAATNYKLLMSAVWDATIEKIKTVEPNASYALEILGIISYFPTDAIYSNPISKLYQSAFERTRSDFQQGMHILNTYSLVSTLNSSGANRIRAHRHVQRCTRAMLESKNDYSYLGIVTSFRHPSITIMEAKLFKKALEQWPWSRSALQEFLLLFSQVLNVDTQSEIKLCLDKVFTLPAFKKETRLISYYSSLCHLRSGQQNNYGILQFNEIEENAFLLAAQVFFGVESASFNDNHYDLRLALIRLWKKLYFHDYLISRLGEKLKRKFGDILLDVAIKAVLIPYDGTITEVYKYLAFYYQDDTLDNARQYLAAAIRSCSNIHKETKYWQFPFLSMSKFFDVEDPNWKAEYQGFVDTFFDEGGSKIMVDSIRNNKSYFNYDPLFKLAVQMTRYPGCSQRLVMAMNFMDTLKDFTSRDLEHDHTIYISCYLRLLLWLGLFTSNRTMQDANGTEWAITSVTKEMKFFVERYKNDSSSLARDCKQHDLRNDDFKPLQPILNTYVTSSTGVYDELAVETAHIMHKAYLSAGDLCYDEW